MEDIDRERKVASGMGYLFLETQNDRGLARLKGLLLQLDYLELELVKCMGDSAPWRELHPSFTSARKAIAKWLHDCYVSQELIGHCVEEESDER